MQSVIRAFSRFSIGIAVFSALLFLAAGPAHSTSVLAVGTTELAANSKFIFHGKVIERWVAAGPRSQSIVTYFRFSVTDVLKGDSGKKSVVLGFLGGTLNGRTLRVEGMTLPTVGDEGVFFVDSPGANLVQPFYGWDQGRFQVHQDGQGRKVIYTHDEKPIHRLDSAIAIRGVSDGHAAGIVTAASSRDALTVDSFKARIREIVEAQQ
jgi:hypothetical protein